MLLNLFVLWLSLNWTKVGLKDIALVRKHNGDVDCLNWTKVGLKVRESVF